MSNPHTIRTVRFVAINPDHEPASYSESCLDINGRKSARYWAIQNASRFGGRVLEETTDGNVRVIRDYSREHRGAQPSTPATSRQDDPQPSEPSV